MFDTIAPTYDRANHLLSSALPRLWWNRTARLFRPILTQTARPPTPLNNSKHTPLPPTLARLPSGQPPPSTYRPTPVQGSPHTPPLIQLIHNAGSAHPTYTTPTSDIHGLYSATKPRLQK